MKNQEYQDVIRRRSTVTKKFNDQNRTNSIESMNMNEFDKEDIEILKRVQTVREMIDERPQRNCW